MTKELTINIGLIALIVISTLWFLLYVKNKYGILPSISQYARELQKDGNQIYFYLWIFLGLVIPVGYVMYTGLTAIGCALVGLIAVWTGYNPNIKTKHQHLMHILFISSGSLCFVVDINLISLWYLIPTFIFILCSVDLLIKKRGNEIYWIEIMLIELVVCGLIAKQF